ncbi:MAG: hypothetical protein ABIG65_00455 [Patescibacteria group bacterium]
MAIKSRKKIYWLTLGLIFSGFLGVENALAFKLGENQLFFVDASYDLLDRTQINATLRQVGDHALFYTANDWWSSLGPVEAESANMAILNLAAEFDKTIYPRLTQVYGSEWSPGIDNDLRITILITKIKKGTGGYFNSSDEYSRLQIANSNEREMIYLNSLYITSPSVRDFLAHEFQHMINFYQKEKLRHSVEEIWLNEARSEYAPTLCGYDTPYIGSNLERRVKDFLRAPSDSLTEWQNESIDYGAVNLFMQYLVGRYGEPILTRMMKTEAVGAASINQALAAAGFSEKFGDVFNNWMIANFVNDCQLGEGQKYCYLNPRLTYESFHLRPQMSNFLLVSEGTEFSFADTIKDWSGRWYEILPMGFGLNLAMNFQGESASDFQIALITFAANGTKSLNWLVLNSVQEAAALISDFGNRVASVVLILSNQTKQTNFSANEPTFQFSYIAKITKANQLPEPTSLPLPSPMPLPDSPILVNPNFSEGSLIRAKGDNKVYIIKGHYRRWLQTPQTLTAYPHLDWQNIIEVTPEQLNWYQEAWLVRADGDARVYEINGDGTKHWLNMSAEQFTSSGRAWEMVYIVNARERDLYRTGAEVLR